MSRRGRYDKRTKINNRGTDFGAFLSVLNQTLINPALPSIMVELGVNATTVQYLVSGFTLVNAIVIAISAFLMDKFSTRKLFLSIFGLFLIGSLLAAFGANFALLLAGRVLQAICAGVMMPLSMTILLLVFPREKRGSAMGMYSFVIMFAPAIGPVISGVLTDTIGWRVMFLGMAAISAPIMLLAAAGLKNVGETKPVAFDKPSVALSSVGLFALLCGFSALGSASTLIFAAVAVVVGAAVLFFFARRQLKLENPFLQIRVLADARFRMGTVAMMLIAVSLAAGAVTLPIYIQTVRGMSATVSGMIMMPGAVLGAFAGYFSGKLYDRFGARYLVIIGVSMVALGAFGMAMFGFDTPLAFMVAAYCILSVGLMFANAPVSIWAIGKLPDSILHHGNAVLSTLRQAASTLGVAVMVSVMSLVTALSAVRGAVRSQLMGINAAYWLSFGIALVCLVLVIVKVRGGNESDPDAERTGRELDAAMKNPPYTLSSDDTLAVAVGKLIEYKTSGLPIVDGEKRIVGFVSDGDVLRHLAKRDLRFVSSDYSAVMLDRESFDCKAKELLDENVLKVASKRVISVEHEATLSEVCRIFFEQKLNKLPVTQDGVLIGTISRGDIMRTLMKRLPLEESKPQPGR
ncbi:MAG: DHA2 family efflux MFS transporter permease subunit [Clostridiales Family XIII bacterium]|nr:DHA2 family efflux MFS transporter permease subunit [Clostridiales Family XIII bacterium]